MMCPDGNDAIKCENGYYNTKEGSITCYPCNNNGAGSTYPDRDMCFLPDTPRDSNSYDVSSNSFINTTMTRPFFAYKTVTDPEMDPKHNQYNDIGENS